MSLLNRLGPQGRALLSDSPAPGTSTYNFQSTQGIRIPNKLDFLLNDLIDASSTTTTDQFLSYLAYYYPTLKNEANVELLTLHFLRSPMIFNLNGSYNQLYRIIECFNYIIDKKLNVSQPTLPFYKFYNGILQGLLKFISVDPINHHWKMLPLLSGVLLSIRRRSNEFCYMDHIGFVEKVDSHLNKILVECLIAFNYGYISDPWRLLYITVLSLNHTSIPDDKLIKISNKSANLPLLILDSLLNSDFGLNKGQAIKLKASNSTNYPPILKNMSSFAMLYGRLIDIGDTERNLNLIDFSLNKIQFFSNELFEVYSALEQQLHETSRIEINETVLKNSLFAIIIIEESIIRNTLYKGLHHSGAVLQNISRKIMISLFNLNFVIEKIGTGGFQSFNFVYLSTIDYLLSSKNTQTTEVLAQIFTSSINFKVLSDSFSHRCRLLFFLNLFESLIHLCSDDIKLKLILPIVEDIIEKNCHLINNKDNLKPILESAHSIVLKYFSILEISPRPVNLNFEVNFNKIHTSLIKYTSNILRLQYPQFLSSAQFLTIIEKLSRLIFPNSVIHGTNHEIYTQFMTLIYQNAKSTSSMNASNLSDDSTKLLTCQAVKISSLIRCTPLLPLPEYIEWLNAILFNLIINNSQLDTVDRNLLLDNLFETILVVNKFDSEKGMVGIDWFYSNVNNEPKL